MAGAVIKEVISSRKENPNEGIPVVLSRAARGSSDRTSSAICSERGFQWEIVNIDALTYAGNLENLPDIAEAHAGSRYEFIKADICDRAAVESAFSCSPA